jgi:hypothetical protein
VKGLFDFLELEPPPGPSGKPSANDAFLEPKPFIPGKSYDSYFTDHERMLAGQVVKAMATPECWSLIRRYFPPVFSELP